MIACVSGGFKTHFRVRIKDYAGYDGQRVSVAVDYLVIGGNCGKRELTCV